MNIICILSGRFGAVGEGRFGFDSRYETNIVCAANICSRVRSTCSFTHKNKSFSLNWIFISFAKLLNNSAVSNLLCLKISNKNVVFNFFVADFKT